MIKSHSGIDTQQVFRSRDGWEFNKYDVVWRLNKNTTVYLGWVGDLKVEIKSSFLTTLLFYSVYSSAAHARNISERAKCFFKFTGGGLILFLCLLIGQAWMIRKSITWVA